MSYYIKGVRLINWRCYKGEQDLDLEPTVYALTASEATNPDRSNWLGKSSFGEAIAWCLTGELRKDELADDWITRGEEQGGVELELSDGTFISRLRTKGSPTVLEVDLPKSDGTTLLLCKEAAQAHLDALTGGKEFYALTSFFGQGKIDQYVRMTPGQRTDVVSEWLNLGPLQEAEAAVRKNKLAPLEKEQAGIAARVQYLEANYPNIGALITTLKTDIRAAEEAVIEAREAVAQASARAQTRASWQAAQRDRADLAKLRQELAGIKPARGRAKLEADVASALVVWQHTKEAESLVARETRAAEELARGAFDGQCPVSKGFACPASSEINKREHKNLTRVEELRTKGRALRTEVADAKLLHDVAVGNLSELNKRATRISGLQEQIETMEARVAQFGDMKEPEQILADAPHEVALEHASRTHAELLREKKQLEGFAAELKEAEPKLQALRAMGSVYRAACLVLGRTGAQRVMAEDALHEIAEHTNTALKRAGVPLSVGVSWSRPTNRLDEACRECGYFFGKGQAVKACPECKAERLPALDLRLCLELSADSGGADDITGFMFQLSASKWLRAYRDRGFPCLFVDEPFGSLDRHNRTALAARLHSMLEQDFGVRQAFLVAHDSDTLDTLPARLVITSEGGYSTIKVA